MNLDQAHSVFRIRIRCVGRGGNNPHAEQRRLQPNFIKIAFQVPLKRSTPEAWAGDHREDFHKPCDLDARVTVAIMVWQSS